MKKIVLALYLSAFATAFVPAASAADGKGGFSLGAAIVPVKNAAANSTTMNYGLKAGMAFYMTDWLAVEGQMIYGISSSNSGVVGWTPVKYNETINIFSLLIKPEFENKGFVLGGIGGASWAYHSDDITTQGVNWPSTGTPNKKSQTKTSASFGAFVGYNLKSGSRVELQAIRHSNTVSSVTLSYVF